ncbi:MAG TPA: alanine racemase [Candidatus Limnocylindrales bacterium]|nr:alanine racemase [Candidatus Limnocylindrales bacterium]
MNETDRILLRSTYRSSWCDVDVLQFHANLRILRRVAGTGMLQVVKANAYGHGLVRMAQEAIRSGAVDMLGVATIGEADSLLDAGLDAPILIMCAMDDQEIDYCVAHNIHFLAWRRDHFDAAYTAASRYGKKPLVHLEADTGMARSGAGVAELANLLDDLPQQVLACIVGLASHFTSADLDDLTHSERQLKEFQESVDLVTKAGLKPLIHLANSPGALRLPDARMGMVRMGIAGYGLPPSDFTRLPDGVAPVLEWKANLTSVKEIGPGQGVGYAWKYIANRVERVATIGVGYADGLRRYPDGANVVLMDNGVSADVVGSVFMDQALLRVPEKVPAKVGDTVVLLGCSGDAMLTAEAIAQRWGTNNYDVVSGIRSRVPRQYITG